MGSYQGMDESPQAFYTKVRHLVDLAGYDNAVKDQVAETTFMNGIHQELRMQIRTTPMILNWTQKVEYANRYWTTRNPMANTLQQTLAPHLRNSNINRQDNRANIAPPPL